MGLSLPVRRGGLAHRALSRFSPEVQRSGTPISLQQYLEMFTFNGVQYQFVPYGGRLSDSAEEPPGSFEGFVRSFYCGNGVVSACLDVRLRVLSEARFQFRQRRSGRPGDLFGTDELEILEEPWANGTTGDLLARMEQDSSIAGNFYAARRPMGLVRMRPDWVAILVGSRSGNPMIDIEVLGYAYYPGGPSSGEDMIPLLVEEVVHFAPRPDPLARFRGMSLLTPIVTEVMSDSAATVHKQKFFEHGATPNLFISLDKDVQFETYKKYQELFEEKFGESNGAAYLNAYKTLFMGGGADAKVIGADMQQIDFKVTQGAGETRIAANMGVPPVIVGLSEGLSAATYSNYAQARRSFADGTLRPWWRNAAASLAQIVEVPPNAELWYDDRDIPFLAEDVKDAAEVQQQQAVSIKQLVDAGFDQKSVVDAIVAGDFRRLKHTGLFSVQLQPPGTSVEGPGLNGQAQEMREVVASLNRLAARHATTGEVGRLAGRMLELTKEADAHLAGE